MFSRKRNFFLLVNIVDDDKHLLLKKIIFLFVFVISQNFSDRKSFPTENLFSYIRLHKRHCGYFLRKNPKTMRNLTNCLALLTKDKHSESALHANFKTLVDFALQC